MNSVDLETVSERARIELENAEDEVANKRREYMRTYMRRYYAINKEYFINKALRWNNLHKQHRKKYMKKYRKEHAVGV